VALRILFTARAEKEFDELQQPDRDRLRERLVAYAADPSHPQHDVRPLTGSRGSYRLRSGNWRALFNTEGDVMWVQRVQHRREVYR
jgi:mRNA-degrading endonuclease RelE of RelBE toxin-antitoxin system